MDFIFTIEMKTPRTMKLPICNCSLAQDISWNISRNECVPILSTSKNWPKERREDFRYGNNWKFAGVLHRFGMALKSRLSAEAATGDILPIVPIWGINSAQEYAHREREEQHASIIRNLPVFNARPYSPQTSMTKPATVLAVAQISLVTVGRPFQVYDLTVDDAHCFYANGVLVGNCMAALSYGAGKNRAFHTRRQKDRIIQTGLDPARHDLNYQKRERRRLTSWLGY